MKIRLLVCSMALAWGATALASDEVFHGRWYVGAAGGISQVQPNTNDSGFVVTDDQDTGTKFLIGRDLTERLSLEIFSADLGSAKIGTADELAYESYGAHLVVHLYNTGSTLGRYFRDSISVYAKAGAGSMQNEGTIPFEQLSDAHLTLGLGVSGHIGAGFNWRFEAETFDEDAALVSLGVVKRFGGVPDPAPPSVDYFQSQRVNVADPESEPTTAPDDAVAEADVPAPLPDDAIAESVDEAVDGAIAAVDPEDDLSSMAAEELESVEAEMAVESEMQVEGADTAVVAADPVDSLSGTEVETSREPQDTDGDGVFDEFDQCDSTEVGRAVDDRGCSFNGVVEGLFFDSSSATLSPAAMDVLDNVIAELLRYPSVLLEVQAHTDNSGPARDNLDLSQQRARSVVQYMVQNGISASRLRAVGYGESRPAYQNATVEGRRLNRRVEFRTVYLR